MVLEYIIGTVAGATGGALVTGITIASHNMSNYSIMKVDEAIKWMTLGTAAGIIFGNYIAYAYTCLNEHTNDISNEAKIVPCKEIKTIDDYLKENNHKITFPNELSYKI